MCFVLFMASDHFRPAIPFDEAKRAINMRHNGAELKRVVRHFSKSHIVFIGSDQGCGCGFPYHYRYNETPEQKESHETNLKALRDHLAVLLKDEEYVELYGCWSGDESAPSSKPPRDIHLAEITAPDFHFDLGEQLIVRS